MNAKSRPPVKDSREYSQEQFEDQSIQEDHQLYARYLPEVFQGHMTMWQGVFLEPPVGTLPAKYKNIICVAIECALMKSNPPPTLYARRAIDEGATPLEVAEAVMICAMLRGMASYWQSGRFALRAAEERYKELGNKAQVAHRTPILEAQEYARRQFGSGSLPDHERYGRYCPEVFQGFMTFRQGAFMEPPGGALPSKYKELVATAVEAAMVVPSRGHGRTAIDEGATLQELAETVSLCIILAGMVSYRHSGGAALQGAEERAKELAEGKALRG